MKISPCSNVMYSGAINHRAVPKSKQVNTARLPINKKETDYGKNMKQLSFVIGMSLLGILSIMLGTKGKFCGIKF